MFFITLPMNSLTHTHCRFPQLFWGVSLHPFLITLPVNSHTLIFVFPSFFILFLSLHPPLIILPSSCAGPTPVQGPLKKRRRCVPYQGSNTRYTCSFLLALSKDCRKKTVPRRQTEGCAELRLLTSGSSHRLSLSGAEVFSDA